MTTPPQQPSAQPLKAYFVLLIVIFAAATGPIFIRNAQLAGVPSLYIIAARLISTSLILAPIVLKRYRAELSHLPAKEWLLVMASGLSFLLNLLFLFVSLEYASVLVTGVMRRTTPLWVIWLEIIFLGAVFTWNVWAGLFLTLVGTALVAFGSGGAVQAGSNPVLGTSLALIGSVSIGVYFLLGRKFSQRLPVLAYTWLVFTCAALIATVFMIITGTPITGYSLNGYMWVVIVTIITQFLGHIPINVGLRYFAATYISIIMQVAVVVSAVLALVAFNEIPSPMQIVGSVAIMLGVVLVNWK